MTERAQAGADCLIVGGGLSGLACAHALSAQGHTVQVLEADATVGGRARSFMHQGEPVDRGFQAVFRGYRETRKFFDGIGLGSGELRPFARGFVVHNGARWERIGVSPSKLVRSGLATPGDVARLARAVGPSVAVPERHLTDGDDDLTATTGLSELGFSEQIQCNVLRPLLAGILLDRSLSADFGYVRYLMSMLARGPAVLPVDGMGMIAQRASDAIRRAGGMIWTGVRVARLDRNTGAASARGVVLEDGRSVAARHVVVALDTANARTLLKDHDPDSAERLPGEPSAVISAAFALDEPLYSGRTLLLDAAAPDEDDRVDLVCQTTNITRPGSPGPHIVLAQSATRGWSRVDPDRYVAAVGERIAAWAPHYPWAKLARPIDVYRHEWAQYRPTPGVRERLPGPRTALTNVILAGDAVMHPSIEGAVSSGHRAARIVHELLA